MESIKIVDATPKDVVQLQNIGIKTFSETFSAVNTPEDMAKYLSESFSINRLTEELSNKLSQFYFAVLDQEVIGYLKLNAGHAQTDLKDHDALEIERIYVSQAFHGKKVGQLLYNKAMEVARQTGCRYVWLGVWENNFRAMSFYKKNGFVDFDRHVFMLGTDKQIDIMMKKDLLNN
ncbi:GNAT family N-acetyltransferase [Mucilaginibacter sp. SMC90]|uniref:GNAT family N-acetyltransferase n=1 Tax=Mucilaginibacter sp. SMC90 TaxID=2929803 RepID=UPI001FB49D8C|nr:GNAT family N-acetyltransferase [Mucilaginibacter sp. SMC90]UOE49115.1 GNAT family N-acetyltransferase [Mucilaginibacter sp. SMC90]